MRYALAVLIAVVFSALSFGLLPQWPQVALVPVGLLWVLAWAVEAGDYSALWTAIIAGLLADSYSGLPVGSFSLPLVLFGELAGTRLRHLFREGPWWHAVLAVVAAMSGLYIWVWLYSAVLFQIHLSPAKINFLPGQATFFVSAAAAILLWYPMQWLAKQLAGFLKRWEAQRHS